MNILTDDQVRNARELGANWVGASVEVDEDNRQLVLRPGVYVVGGGVAFAEMPDEWRVVTAGGKRVNATRGRFFVSAYRIRSAQTDRMHHMVIDAEAVPVPRPQTEVRP